MIKFNTLNVDSKNRVLALDLEIDDNISYYRECYITSIKIDNQKTYTPSGPSENAYTVYEYTEGDTTIREYSEVITAIFSNPYTFTTNDLFFVYVTISDDIPADTPCGYDILTTIGIAFDKKILYNGALSNIRLFAQHCGDKTQLVDYILYHKYFDLCLKAGRIENAIILWNQLLGTTTIVQSSNCGCNGRP